MRLLCNSALGEGIKEHKRMDERAPSGAHFQDHLQEVSNHGSYHACLLLTCMSDDIVCVAHAALTNLRICSGSVLRH